MYQVPDFYDRNRSSFAEAAGRAVGVGWLQRLAIEHAHFLSHVALNLSPAALTASCFRVVALQ